MSQQDLFFDAAGNDNSRPLPDEDPKDYGAMWEAREEALNAGDAPIVKRVNRPASDPFSDQDRRMAKEGTQGKCMRCRECYRWHSRRPLRLAYCPECGDKLVGTTHLNRRPWNVGVEPLTAVQAWAKFKKA